VLIANFFNGCDKEKFKRQWSFSNIVRFVEFIYSTISTLLNFTKPENQWKLESDNDRQLGCLMIICLINSINETENYIFSLIAF
jgi:hypothetical protein